MVTKLVTFRKLAMKGGKLVWIKPIQLNVTNIELETRKIYINEPNYPTFTIAYTLFDVTDSGFNPESYKVLDKSVYQLAKTDTGRTDLLVALNREFVRILEEYNA